MYVTRWPCLFTRFTGKRDVGRQVVVFNGNSIESINSSRRGREPLLKWSTEANKKADRALFGLAIVAPSAWVRVRHGAATGVRPRSVALRSTVPDLPQSRPFLLDSSNERRSHVGHSHVRDYYTTDYYAVVYFTILRSLPFEDTFYANNVKRL